MATVTLSFTTEKEKAFYKKAIVPLKTKHKLKPVLIALLTKYADGELTETGEPTDSQVASTDSEALAPATETVKTLSDDLKQEIVTGVFRQLVPVIDSEIAVRVEEKSKQEIIKSLSVDDLPFLKDWQADLDKQSASIQRQMDSVKSQASRIGSVDAIGERKRKEWHDFISDSQATALEKHKDELKAFVEAKQKAVDDEYKAKLNDWLKTNAQEKVDEFIDRALSEWEFVPGNTATPSEDSEDTEEKQQVVTDETTHDSESPSSKTAVRSVTDATERFENATDNRSSDVQENYSDEPSEATGEDETKPQEQREEDLGELSETTAEDETKAQEQREEADSSEAPVTSEPPKRKSRLNLSRQTQQPSDSKPSESDVFDDLFDDDSDHKQTASKKSFIDKWSRHD